MVLYLTHCLEEGQRGPLRSINACNRTGTENVEYHCAKEFPGEKAGFFHMHCRDLRVVDGPRFNGLKAPDALCEHIGGHFDYPCR